MAKVKDVMTRNVLKVNSWVTVLEASKTMNRRGASASVVVEGEKVVGMLGERGLLRKFIPLNKKPDEVRVGELMVPILKIEPEASTRAAAKKLVQSGYTRVGVFDGDKFLGWVTLRDLAREFSKQRLLDALRSPSEPEPNEVLCPHCQSAFLEKISTREGEVAMWKCPKCGYAL